MEKLFGICGPTASGKTAAAVALCEMLGGEVISADSMQLYRGMDILSAKPSKEETRGIPHHLIGIAEPSEKFNASKYRELARRAVDGIRARGALPVLCGGTGLYIDALTRPIRMAEQADEKLREALKKEAETPEGRRALHRRLAEVDPVSAAKYPPEDARRVIRSLEICLQTGKTRAEQEAEDAQAPDVYETHLYAPDWDRAVLYGRIDRRVDDMVRQGLVEEVRELTRREESVQETAAQAIG